jgi:hypothetical protein
LEKMWDLWYYLDFAKRLSQHQLKLDCLVKHQYSQEH